MNARDPKEENVRNMLRRVAEVERSTAPSKQAAAGRAAEKQMPLIVRDDEVDRFAVRTLLIDFNLAYIGSANRQKTKTGRVAEEVRTPEGTLGKRPLQLELFEADAIIARKRDLAAGNTVEADYLQALRDLAAERAAERGLDPDVVAIVIGDYVHEDEAEDIRRRYAS